MVSPLALAGIAFVALVNTALAAIAIRFFRIRLNTQWGAVVYAVLLVPLLLVVSTLVLSGMLRLGGSLGSRDAGLVVAFVVPLVLGAAIDLFWMPHPDDVELPDTTDEGGVDERGTE